MTYNICGTSYEMIDVLLIFHDVPERRGFFWRFLKPGFQHVQTWVKFEDLWVQIDGCLEAMFVKAFKSPPWELMEEEQLEKYSPTFFARRHGVKLGQLREPFHIGPVTCVDLTKALLGIRAPLVRTPWQLYKYLKKNT